MDELQHKQMLTLSPHDMARRNAMRIRNFKWTRQNVKAAALLAENRLTQKQIATEVGCGARQVAAWLQVPAFKQHIQKLVEETRKQLAQRYIAQQDQRIASYIEDFERTDQIIAERAAHVSMAEVPGGKTGLVVRDVKAVGDEVVELYEFDAALVRERRAIRKDIAEETGQIVQRHEIKNLRDARPEDLTPELLNALAEHFANQVSSELSPETLEKLAALEAGVVVDAVSEVVEEKGSTDESR